ncbi:MAG: hypothetical protein HYZ54_13695 [Ignavibacteriae bacterium]|nr:hypothetical protein [Ignavibacteriota bacterium]
MFPIQELIEKKVQQKINDGYFFPEVFENLKSPLCVKCNKILKPEQAHHWGKEVKGYFQWALCDCFRTAEAQVKQATALSTSLRTQCDCVVLVQGRPCFITENEKDQYLQRIMGGSKAVMIRDYVFDKIYPIIPFEEYQQDQERRDKEVETRFTTGE